MTGSCTNSRTQSPHTVFVMPDILDLEDVSCDLCGSFASREVLIGRDFRYAIPGEFVLRRCIDCHLVFLSPRPTRSSLSTYYPTAYARHLSSHQAHSSGVGRVLRRLILTGPRLPATLFAFAYNAFAYRAFVPISRAGA